MKKAVFLVIIIMLSLFLSLTSINAAEIEKNKFCITNIYPENLHPSEVSTVSLTIKNIGTRSAYHVATEILVDDKSPVKVIGKAKKSVGYTIHSIGVDGEVTVQYDFYIDKDARATVYHIPMRVIWSDKPEEEGEIVKINNETFYIGINVGAFLSSLIVGTVGEVYGWHYGFGLAGIGMALGLIQYLVGQKYLKSLYFLLKKNRKRDLYLTLLQKIWLANKAVLDNWVTLRHAN